jgi:hypothetical protein
MSADNFIGVISLSEGEGWLVCEGNMSALCEREGDYVAALKRRGGRVYTDRASALLAAHDRLKTETVVEYGVIELGPPDPTPSRV